MAYPLILPFEEQDERHKFSNFMWRIFTPAKASSTQFEGSLTAEALMSIYKVYRPDTILTTDMISHMIMYGGYMNAQGELYFRIKSDIFKDLPPATQEKILSYCNYAKSLALRQIMMGNDPAAVDNGIILNESFRHFVQTQIFDKKFKFWNAIPKGQRKTSTADMYEYYSYWCFHLGYIPESRNAFLGLFKNLNYKIKKGYYKGASGVSIIENVVIPQTDEERKLMLQYKGLGVLCLQNHVLFNDSTATKDYSTLGLQAYIEGRRCISSVKSCTKKERAEEKEAKQQADSNRGGAQISTNAISGGKKEISKTEEGRANRGNDAKDKSVTQTDSRTSCGVTEGSVSKNKPSAITGAKNRSASDIVREHVSKPAKAGGDTHGAASEIGRNANGQLGGCISGNYKEIPEVEIPLTGASKKAFYTSLRITVRLSAPGTFNFEKFCDEIDRANLGVLSEAQKRALYDDFMKTIKK